MRCCSVEICYGGAQGVEIEVYKVEGLHHVVVLRYAIGVHKGLRYKSTKWRDFTTSRRKGPHHIKLLNTQSGICEGLIHYAELDVA